MHSVIVVSLPVKHYLSKIVIQKNKNSTIQYIQLFIWRIAHIDKVVQFLKNHNRWTKSASHVHIVAM